MVAKSISFVAEEPNRWDGPNGTIYFVNGSFHDGDTFSIGSKSEADALNHRSALANLIDQEHEFDLVEGKPRGEGKTGIKWKFGKPGYPGDPREPYGYSDSARPSAPQGPSTATSGAPVALNGPSRDDSISRAVALKAAATFWSGIGATLVATEPVSSDEVLATAEEFLQWLTAGHLVSASDVVDAPAVTAGEGSPGAQQSPAAGTSPAQASPGPVLRGEPPGSGATSVSSWVESNVEFASPELLALLTSVYGDTPKAFAAARKAVPHLASLDRLTAKQADDLIEAVEG